MRAMPLTSARVRSRVLALLATVAVALIACASVAAARPAQQNSTSTTTPAVPEIFGGVTATGGVVHTPGQPDRTLDADQVTAFMQYWLPASVFQNRPQAKPPAGVTVSTLDVTTHWQGQDIPIKVYFASQGDNAWVGMPAQDFGWALVDKERWIEAPQPQKLISAFQGKEKAVTGDPGPAPAPTTATTATTPTTVAGKAAAASSGADSGSALPWVLGGIGLVVVAGLVVFLVARRRSGAASSPTS